MIFQSTTKFKKKSNNLLEQKQTFPELTNNIGSILSNKNEVKHTLNPSSFPAQKPETIWINLNDVQKYLTSVFCLITQKLHVVCKIIIFMFIIFSSTVTSAGNSQTSKTTPNKSISQIKSEKLVEFYDFHSRYHCKTFREYPNLVEKIDSKTEVSFFVLFFIMFDICYCQNRFIFCSLS